MQHQAADVERLNAIGVLIRREIEARILAPVIEALGREFPRDRVIAIVRDVIVETARQQGHAMAASSRDQSLTAFAGTLGPWRQDNAMQIDVIEQTENRFAFNVTRCRYAEMYRELGMGDLGTVLSCNRDAALIEGFNPDIKLTRTQTIMEGASCCDFRYSRRSPAEQSGE